MFRPRALPHWALALSLLVLNGYIVLRLFEVEFHDHMGSIEGAFIAMARYFRDYGVTAWWPWWYGGYPTPLVYPPGLHVSVGWLSELSGWSIAHAYHRLTAFTYSLGAVTFYALLWAFTRSKAAAWCGAVLVSVASPSALLLPSITGGSLNWRNPRRFEAMAVWGEGPNITGLMLLPLAVLCVHWALETRRPEARICAVLSLASVPLVNWPSAIALAVAMLCYLLSRDAKCWPRAWTETALLGVAGYALIAPWLPPSAVLQTLGNAHTMGGRPTRDAAYYLGWYALLLTLVLLARWLHRQQASLGIRFFALNTAFLTHALLLAEFGDVQILPQTLRFHLAWEFAFAGLLVLVVHHFVSNRRLAGTVAISAVVLLAVVQVPHTRAWVRGSIQAIDITQKVEYQVASWFARATPDEPVFALGSVEFWMNVFTDTPQVIGCCEQSVTNPVYRAIGYVMGSDDGTNGKETEISLLWLKTTGARAVWIGGPNSREIYHDYRHPGKFDYLELAWQDGDDRIFWVPKRQPGLAHVVRHEHLVPRTPENGIDIEPLRQYVAGLEEDGLPLVRFSRPSPDEMTASGTLRPEHVLSFQVNYHPGWRATVNGEPAPVKKDGMGYLYVEPGCEGDCAVALRFTGGREAKAATAASVFSLVLLVAVAVRRPRKSAAPRVESHRN